MPVPDSRWTVMSENDFSWEQDALDYLKDKLGDYVLHAWRDLQKPYLLACSWGDRGDTLQSLGGQSCPYPQIEPEWILGVRVRLLLAPLEVRQFR